jgi:hypothetical protein
MRSRLRYPPRLAFPVGAALFSSCRRARAAAGAFAFAFGLLGTSSALAQGEPPPSEAPLTPLPALGPDDSPPPPPPAPAPSGPAATRAPALPKHAPRYSLWLGSRVGVLGFGGGFYGVAAIMNGGSPLSVTEWTTDIATPGPTLQADVGARLGRRFIPFAFYERAFLSPGSQFAGLTGASAYSDLFGLGLRFLAGDPDVAAFLTEFSIGERTVGVTANGQTYRMSGFEYFKLGLGAEIRLSSRLVLSPLASLSTGALTSTSGSVTFSTPGPDGATHPPYENGASIQDQRGYVMLSLTCGAHFDLLGK